MPVSIKNSPEPRKQSAKVKSGKRGPELGPAAVTIAMVVVLALIASAYYFFMRGPAEDASSSDPTAATSAAMDGSKPTNPAAFNVPREGEDPTSVKERIGPITTP